MKPLVDRTASSRRRSAHPSSSPWSSRHATDRSHHRRDPRDPRSNRQRIRLRRREDRRSGSQAAGGERVEGGYTSASANSYQQEEGFLVEYIGRFISEASCRADRRFSSSSSRVCPWELTLGSLRAIRSTSRRHAGRPLCSLSSLPWIYLTMPIVLPEARQSQVLHSGWANPASYSSSTSASRESRRPAPRFSSICSSHSWA